MLWGLLQPTSRSYRADLLPTGQCSANPYIDRRLVSADRQYREQICTRLTNSSSSKLESQQNGRACASEAPTSNPSASASLGLQSFPARHRRSRQPRTCSTEEAT